MEWLKALLEMPGIITNLTHKLNPKPKIQTLKRKMETLASKEADICYQLNIEEKRPGKKRKVEVKDWLENLGRLSREVHDVVQKTWLQQLTLGSSLDKLIRELEVLHEESRHFEGLTLDVKETRGCELPVGKLVGKTFKSNLKKIWNSLKSDNVQNIGVQGMGGVGKTTLVKRIHNRILNKCEKFESPFWITVSQDCSVRKLQDAIAKHLHLDFENENDEMIRAGKLCEALKERTAIKKLVIILDDVWEYYHLEKIGMPLKRNGCKLILTSRKKDVCYQMNCDEVVEVATLHEQEAWCLFRDNLRCGSPLSPLIEEIAQAVARECAGLPLGIVVLSGIMRGVNDIHEWRNTLKELRESKFKVERMEDEVFKILQFSFQRLHNMIMQQCFLHVALYPEDEEVEKDELIQYFIDSTLIEKGGTWRVATDKGHAILNKLVKSCLLEEGRALPHSVKMHDLVRDMGINITNNHFMVKAGQKLTEIPDDKEWIESLEKVSLMENTIEEISLNASPRCPNISTLLLQRNPLVSIPNSFFKQMQTLQILNLSQTDIEELPDSFSDLENLIALHLMECEQLTFVPSLAKMQALRTLNLYGSGIEEMPQGMERLCSLMYLNLGETKGLEETQWQAGILPQLKHLQFLNLLGGAKITNVKELMSLSKLEYLACWFDDAFEFSTYMRYLWGRTPHVDEWVIALGNCTEYHILIDSKTVSLRDYDMEGIGTWFQLPDDVVALNLRNCPGVTSISQWGTVFPKLKYCDISHMRDLREIISNSFQPVMTPSNCSFLSSLKSLAIHSCPRLKKLLTPQLLPLFTHVEYMTVTKCEELEEIIAIEDYNHVDPFLHLPKLLQMRLENLPQLKSICRAKWMMKCVSLQSLHILECPKLERIPLVKFPKDFQLSGALLGKVLQASFIRNGSDR